MFFDEVYVVFVDVFCCVILFIKLYFKFGFIVIFFCEDDKIFYFNFFIGFKFYEVNWMELF